jgi:hypothetical protein
LCQAHREDIAQQCRKQSIRIANEALKAIKRDKTPFGNAKSRVVALKFINGAKEAITLHCGDKER